MTLAVPITIQQYLADLDAKDTSIDDFISVPIDAPTDGSDRPLEQERGVFAEVAIWKFMRPNMFERVSAWGTYWSEMTSGTYPDGRRVFFPNADDVDAEIIAYWINRARETRHPVLRARYADVAWEIGRYLRQRGKANQEPTLAGLELGVDVAKIAIDGYLQAVEFQLTNDYSTSWKYLNRAIELSKSLKDVERLARCRAALFALRDVVRSVDPHAGQTWRFYDIVSLQFPNDLNAAEKSQIIGDLQAELQLKSDTSNPKTFDPHAATALAERLQQWSRLVDNPDIGRQAQQTAGAAFEHAAAMAGGLVAVSWLEDLLPRYRAIGDVSGAQRVEQAIRQRAGDARAEMKSHSVTVEIPREEFDKIADEVCGQSLDHALTRVVVAGLMNYESTLESVKKTLEGSPLFAMISITLTGPEGFTEATVGGIDEDEEGRAVHYAGQMINMQAGMLARIFGRILQKYKPTAAQLADYIEACPLFGNDRRPLLERGLQAWLDQDSIVSAHLLIPQLEAALRSLCVKVGGSVMTPSRRFGGFRVNGMGAVLNQPRLLEVMPPNVRFHLTTLLTDPRGLSARNHLAHGMSLPESLGMGLCNWIVHAVLTVAQFR